MHTADLNDILKDLKVIDLSTVLAGPSVGSFLGHLGAEVIKIEHPVHGDVTRTWKLPSEPGDTTISNYYASVNSKKQVRKMDLKQAEELAELKDLISTSDVLISNFKKGDDVKFGLTRNALKSLNPLLIHAKISGFGSQSDRVAYDLILQAETGFMSMNGQPDSLPTKMPVALIDVLAAHHLKEAILLGLIERGKTQNGIEVSVSLYDAALSSLMNQASNYLMSGHIPTRIGSLHPNIAPYGEVFATADGKYVTFAIGSDAHFERLLAYLDLAHLGQNNKYASNQQRVNNRQSLFEELQAVLKLKTSTDILLASRKRTIPCAEIKDLKAVFESPSAQEMVIEEEMEGHMTKKVNPIAFQWHKL